MAKGTIRLVHLYPREMSIYGDLGNTRALVQRIQRHGYDVELINHAPGDDFRDDAHLVVGGGGQDSGQARVTEDLARIGGTLASMAKAGIPMLAICGTYQLFGNAFITVEGQRLPGLGILDVTTSGGSTRMIGGVVLDTEFGRVVGFENHSGITTLGAGQQPFGAVLVGKGNNGNDKQEGARSHNVLGTYLHGPLLPANPAVADFLIGKAVEVGLGREFAPGEIDDTTALEAQKRQITRLLA